MSKPKSSHKAARAAQRKATYNKPIRTGGKTLIARAEELIAAGDLASAEKAVLDATRALDKAAAKKVIHANNAARRKSRLLKKFNQAKTASQSSQ